MSRLSFASPSTSTYRESDKNISTANLSKLRHTDLLHQSTSKFIDHDITSVSTERMYKHSPIKAAFASVKHLEITPAKNGSNQQLKRSSEKKMKLKHEDSIKVGSHVIELHKETFQKILDSAVSDMFGDGEVDRSTSASKINQRNQSISSLVSEKPIPIKSIQEAKRMTKLSQTATLNSLKLNDKQYCIEEIHEESTLKRPLNLEKEKAFHSFIYEHGENILDPEIKIHELELVDHYLETSKSRVSPIVIASMSSTLDTKLMDDSIKNSFQDSFDDILMRHQFFFVQFNMFVDESSSLNEFSIANLRENVMKKVRGSDFCFIRF